jgi:hypothetical protein
MEKNGNRDDGDGHGLGKGEGGGDDYFFSLYLEMSSIILMASRWTLSVITRKCQHPKFSTI